MPVELIRVEYFGSFVRYQLDVEFSITKMKFQEFAVSYTL